MLKATAIVRRKWTVPLRRMPMEPKPKTVRGLVHIHEERCKGCGFCIEFCPKGVLASSPKFNSKGYHPPYVVKPEECVNCNLCWLVCPEFAIFSTPIDENSEAKTEKPVTIAEKEMVVALR